MEGESERMRVGCIFIPVKDLERAATWYEKFLSVKRIDSWGEGMGLYFPEGPTQLGLIQVDHTTTTEFSITAEKKNTYFNLLTQDIENVYSRLKQQGVEVSEMQNFGGMLCFDAKDLDGNILSFVDESKGSPYHSDTIREKQERDK